VDLRRCELKQSAILRGQRELCRAAMAHLDSEIKKRRRDHLAEIRKMSDDEILSELGINSEVKS